MKEKTDKIIIKGGRVVDPSAGIDQVFDILIEGEKISGLGSSLNVSSAKVIDASGKIVLPGFVDMHVHLREPGREDKETVDSGTEAALRGGVTSLLAMPNTSPAIDSPEAVKLLKGIIAEGARVNVFIASAITKGRIGRELVDFSALSRQGVLAVTDDGVSVDDEKILFEAFKRAKKAGLLVICHCEDKALSNDGVVNLGFTSTKLGLRGVSRESEYKRVQRDIDLAKKAGARLHIAHVSCKESVEIIASSRRKAVKVTAETAPHYFSLTEEALCGYDANFKMSPPLRRQEDLEAIREGLRDGTIDAIASDHAPHTQNEKDIEFDRAEFGVIGLQTEFSVAVTELVCSGLLNWKQMAEKLSLNPARILGLNKGTLKKGSDADVVVVDPEKTWVVEKGLLASRSRNSAFLGRRLKGVVECVIRAGDIADGIHR